MTRLLDLWQLNPTQWGGVVPLSPSRVPIAPIMAPVILIFLVPISIDNFIKIGWITVEVLELLQVGVLGLGWLLVVVVVQVVLVVLCLHLAVLILHLVVLVLHSNVLVLHSVIPILHRVVLILHIVILVLPSVSNQDKSLVVSHLCDGKEWWRMRYQWVVYRLCIRVNFSRHIYDVPLIVERVLAGGVCVWVLLLPHLPVPIVFWLGSGAGKDGRHIAVSVQTLSGNIWFCLYWW